MKKAVRCLLVLAMAVLLLSSCCSYYRVTAPGSENIYYTEKIDQMKSGAIKFKDSKTGSEVILQSSEVKEIDSKEFKEGIKTSEK